MRKQEVINIIQGQIKGYDKQIETFKGDKNSQVIEMLKDSESKKEAYEEMLEYFTMGSKLYFSFDEEGNMK